MNHAACSRIAGAAVALLFGLRTQVHAWNDAGHAIVSELAWRTLAADEREAASQLLRQHPHYQTLLTADVPAGVDSNAWAFLRASTWPDLVRPARPDEPPKSPEVTAYHRGEWHYIDQAFIAPADRDAMRDLAVVPKPTNIVERLSAMEDLLRSKAPAPERAVALCWYLHLMGDVHQPLHTVSLFSRYYPTGDAGGNRVAIKLDGQPTKLHEFWDNILTTQMTATAIASIADAIQSAPTLASEQIPEFRDHTSYQSWADESKEAAIAHAYLDGKLPHRTFRKDLVPEDLPALPETYAVDARQVADRRAALAAARLARKLQDLF